MTKIKLSISGPHKQISLKRFNKYLKQLLTNNVIYSPYFPPDIRNKQLQYLKAKGWKTLSKNIWGTSVRTVY